MSLRVQLLDSSHDRSTFDCGESDLNEFLKRYARQNDKRNISRTYVLTEDNQPEIIGYYTICTGSVSFQSMPKDLARKLPRYPIPTAHIGRLAIDSQRQGKGLGGILLADALKRIRKTADVIGINVVTVQALHANAAKFYKAHGFKPFQDDPLHLFLPLDTIRNL